jgi:hypothetical protein
MAVGLLLLAACSTGEEVEPGPVTSFEDIAGTYQRQGPGGPIFIHFFEDETFWHASQNRDLVEDRPTTIMETRFEGTTVFVNNSKGRCVDEDAIAGGAIYEIHLLENGNLQLVVIEDTCALRATMYQPEFAPVP